MMDTIQGSGREDVRVLNLFAYTGGATMACASAGAAEVVHVDASKGMVNWAKENMMLSHLENHKIRFIVDDVLKFVAREKEEAEPTMLLSWIRQAMAEDRMEKYGKLRNSCIR